MPSAPQLQSSGNRLLAKFSPEEIEILAPEAELLRLERHTRLIEPNKPIRDVYFPLDCLASLVAVLEDGTTVESGSVGREGMVGVPVVLGAMSTPMQTVVQVPGDGVRIPAKRMKEAFDLGGPMKDLLNRYVHLLFVAASQSAACNRRHQIEARLARWLLLSADGIGREQVEITHEYLAAMLGVRRSSVTESALKLQERGLIDYRRASVTIVDRPSVEAVACECYGIIKREAERVLG